MISTIKKSALRQRRIWRIRKKVQGTSERPRLCVHFSGRHIYAQAIDDVKGHTLCSVSTVTPDLRARKLAANRAGAQALGEAFVSAAKAAAISTVVFDRNGRRFHGTVKAFADAVRAGGISF